MVGMTGLDLPQNSLKGQIASAIHVVIQQQRMSDGRRRVTSIQEILGMESGTVTMQEIYRFERTGMDSAGNIQGQHRATGVRPKFLRQAEEYGLPIPAILTRSQ
jgi:pilus assembly protein CpaF